LFADVRTGILCNGIDHDIFITGRGVISGELVPRASGAFGQCLFHIQMSENNRVSISGIAVVDAPMMQMCLGGGQVARPHEVRGVKLITPESKNSDGIHAGPAQIVDDCFIVAHDDALDVGQGVYFSLITNTTVWNTWGSAILISWNAKHDTGNAIVDGLDVIRWQGDIYNTNESVILIRHGCTGNLSNFTFSNVRVERTGINSRLLGWSIGPTSWSCDAPGCACGTNASDANLGSISGITLRDVTMDGPSVGLHGGHNFIDGFSADRQISDVRFEGLRINGTLVTSAAAMGLELGPFVRNVTFAGAADPPLKATDRGGGQLHGARNLDEGVFNNVAGLLGGVPLSVIDSGASINLTTVLLSPVYRGRIVKGGCKAIKLRAHTDFPQHYDILELELVATLSHRISGSVVETTSGGALQSVVDLAFKVSPESLDAGEYTVSCSLHNTSSGAVLHQMSHNVTRVADSAPQPTAWIDEHHRLIYKGKSKFVLGLYMSWIPDDPGDPGWSTPADDIDMIGNSSFNTIMPYWVLV
jgi:hypothetical protein